MTSQLRVSILGLAVALVMSAIALGLPAFLSVWAVLSVYFSLEALVFANLPEQQFWLGRERADIALALGLCIISLIAAFVLVVAAEWVGLLALCTWSVLV